MPILLDAVIIGIVILSTYLGYKKGLIAVAFKMVSFLIALVLTFLLYKPVTGFIIEYTNWDENLHHAIYEKIVGSQEEENKKLGSGSTTELLQEGIENTFLQAKENMAEVMAANVSHTILQIGTMLALFAGIRLLLQFAKVLLQAVSELPLVKQCNETGGIIYGFLRGGLVICLLLAIANFVLPMLENKEILAIIQTSIITNFLYQHNPILILFF